ncbi:IclR family transcriptional regulator C-terminal domain-containing protein [Streptomyces sp. NPDC096046]|uniref:IclR family transcriptional regulator n=1 Tax=Streptomyces sp. NPDC096046 TaxID=3155542 RepID=UPI00332EAD50
MAVRAFSGAASGAGVLDNATASGRAILAHLPTADVDEVVRRGLERFSDATPTDPVQLRAELERVRAGGFSVNLNQYRPGVCAVAAAILDGDGAPLATITVSMPESRYDAARLPELGRLVADTAKEIAARRTGE